MRFSERNDGVELLCAVDRYAIVAVFRPLLQNALAVSGNPSEITIGWFDTALPAGAALEVAIRDNGPGLSAEDAGHLFEPFFTARKHGAGLGMAIARRIVEAHGGQIMVGQTGPTGTEVVVRLPRGMP